jgi:hypothetical protein
MPPLPSGSTRTSTFYPSSEAIFYIISIILMMFLAYGCHQQQITAMPGINLKMILMAGMGYIGKSKTLHIKLSSWISISNWQTAKYTQTLTKIA